MAFTIPFGKSKGTALDQADSKDLQYCITSISKKLVEEPNGPYGAKNRQWLDAAQAELARRSGQQSLGATAPPQRAAPPATTRNGGSAHEMPKTSSGAAMTIASPADVEQVQGSYRDPAKLNLIFDQVRRVANLVSPAPAVGRLPAGCAVALAVVWVDTREMSKGGEIYPTGSGNYGIAKSALLRISGAAGISWDIDRCLRLDDGSHPHYCCYRAVGSIVDFDGMDRVLPPKTIELDLRNGSAQIESIEARSRSGDVTAQLREMRLFILRHTEGRAIAGVVRNIGMKTSFTLDELSKPFVCARLMFTGESDDAGQRAKFETMIAAKMLGGRASLYGGAQLPARAAPVLQQPPPLGTVTAPIDEGDDYDPAALGAADAPAATTAPAPAAAASAPAGKPMREPGDDADEFPV